MPPKDVDAPMIHRSFHRAPWPAGEARRARTASRPTNPATNTEHQPDRTDHWDAYVCRFDGDGTGEPDRPTP